MRKPDAYFLPAWRRAPGGGPVLINLIHEIDLLRCLAEEIVAVGGCTSSAVRGFATEDSAALTLSFAGGAVGAMVLSDAAVSPWSWEQASGENAVRFVENDQNPYRFFGTEAALEFPRLTLWRHDGPASWSRPIAVPRADVFSLRIAHFARVLHGREGQRTLAATLALFEASRTGRTVRLNSRRRARSRPTAGCAAPRPPVSSCWLVTRMSAVERRRPRSMEAIVYTTVTVSPSSTGRRNRTRS